MKRGADALKAAALAGALSMSPEMIAQKMTGNWTVVSEQEFDRHSISEHDVQTIDLKINAEEVVDDQKKGVKFTDRSGKTYYWVNSPVRDRDAEIRAAEEEKEEREMQSILSDPEMAQGVEKFRSDYKIGYPWAVDPMRANKRFIIKSSYEYVDPPEDFIKLSESVLLIDKETSRKVLVEPDTSWSPESLYAFVFNIYAEDIKEFKSQLKMFLAMNDKLDAPLKEKIEFLKPYFIKLVPDAFDNLPQFTPPVMAEPKHSDQYEEDIKVISRPETGSDNDIHIDENKLKDLLDD